MSHFTCFVVGDVDTVMEKYNEQDENFFKPMEFDIEYAVKMFKEGFKDSEDTKKRFYEEYPSEEDRHDIVKFFSWYEHSTPVYNESDLQEYFDEKKAVFLVEDGEIKKAYYYGNPNAEYDYYCVIGEDSWARWHGLSFKMKDGSYANSGLMKDLDIDGTVSEEVEKDRAEYRIIAEGVGKLSHTPWKEYLDRVDKKEINIDEARALYNNQEDVKRFKKWANENHRWLSADDYFCTEEEYVRNTTFPVFCANILGEWIEKGDMGWWAVVTDEKDPSVWKKMIEEKLHEVQEKYPDEEFHVLDCHI